MHVFLLFLWLKQREGAFCRVVIKEPRAFLMGQTRSPEGPQALAHEFKPLTNPTTHHL